MTVQCQTVKHVSTPRTPVHTRLAATMVMLAALLSFADILNAQNAGFASQLVQRVLEADPRGTYPPVSFPIPMPTRTW